MNQPRLAAYPAGVPAQINPARYPSVAALFAESCSRFRDRPAVTSMGVTLAYRDLQRLVGHFAAWLQADGIGKGDRVAIMLPNVLQYAVVLFGVLRAGAAVVNINPLYTASELTQQLADSGARAIVVLGHFAGSLERALQQAGGWLFTGDMGRMDERGYVTFVERKKEVIVVSGFKAYPAEIEVVARLHPGVDDVAAVGVPDAHSGEAVALAVVRRHDRLTAQALLEHCGQHLAGYKLPRRIDFVDALPKSPIGKTLRRQVREAVLKQGTAQRDAG